MMPMPEPDFTEVLVFMGVSLLAPVGVAMFKGCRTKACSRIGDAFAFCIGT